METTNYRVRHTDPKQRVRVHTCECDFLFLFVLDEYTYIRPETPVSGATRGVMVEIQVSCHKTYRV